MSLSLRAAVLMPYRAQCNDETGASRARGRVAEQRGHKCPAMTVPDRPSAVRGRAGQAARQHRPARPRERFGAALIALIEEKANHEVMIRGSARSRQTSAAPLLSSLSK